MREKFQIMLKDFMREVVCPDLDAAGVVYQAMPTLRVHGGWCSVSNAKFLLFLAVILVHLKYQKQGRI
jgi:hypothetical protein